MSGCLIALGIILLTIPAEWLFLRALTSDHKWRTDYPPIYGEPDEQALIESQWDEDYPPAYAPEEMRASDWGYP